MNAVSKPSPLCMACSALAVRGVQRWPSVPHTWWGCGGACKAWRGTECRGGAIGVPLGCCWGAAGVGVRAAAKAHSSESSESEGCAARPPTAAAAALLGLARLPAPACDGGGGLLTSLGARGTTRARMRRCGAACGAAVCGAVCARGMYAWRVARHVARHVRARGRGESAVAHHLPCSV